MSLCANNAINAASRSVDLIARRLQDDLDSLNEQLNEIGFIFTYETVTEENRDKLRELRHKILALSPYRPETLIAKLDRPTRRFTDDDRETISISSYRHS